MKIIIGPSPYESLRPVEDITKEDEIKEFHLDDEFEKVGINFVAIDLETAGYEKDTICEIGLCFVEGGNIVKTQSWLVRPEDNFYDSFNISIHGITPEDTESCPPFEEVWKDVVPLLNGKIVVAHNTSFDMYALRETFIWGGIDFPDFINFCSCRLAKKAFPGFYSYSLDEVCNELDIDMGRHHRAGDDAKSCANIFLECLKVSGAKSFQDLQDIYKFRCGRFADNYFRPQRSYFHGRREIKVIQGDPTKIDEDNYFYGKSVCFTGKCQYALRNELLQKIADIGGIPMNSVTAKTDVLVVGQQDYKRVGEEGMSSKQKKAMAMKDKGMDIEIMSEADFLNNI